MLFFLRCDGAGVESKKLAQAKSRDRASIRTSKQVASALNASNYSNSVAFAFENIARPESRFPALVVDESLDLRKMCEVKYTYEDADGNVADVAGWAKDEALVSYCRRPRLRQRGHELRVFAAAGVPDVDSTAFGAAAPRPGRC